MRKNYGLLLKKESIVINGKKSYVLCFVSSMEYEKTTDDKFLLIDIDNSIEKSCNKNTLMNVIQIIIIFLLKV